MSIVLIQLSDIHLSINKVNNTILERVSELCGAIRSELNHSDNCILVFSGDIADWGKAEEYDLAIRFISQIRTEVQAHLKNHPVLLLIPGNHDIDFEFPDVDEEIREMIIDKCSQKNPPNDAMNEYCLKPQQPFRDFAENAASKLSAFSVSTLAGSHVCTLDSVSVRIHLLNTTRFTRKKEIPAASWFPIDILEKNLTTGDEPNTFTIGVLHHPYNWHNPDNGKELRRVLESRCDIIFTGHEHNSDIYKKTKRATEQNLYIEGGVLQDHENPDNSVFNVVTIIPERQTFLVKTVSWTGTKYEPLTDPYEHRYLRLRQPLLNEYIIRDEWVQWLEQIGTDFRHPRCRELRLSDLFVYPDLQRLDVRKACSPTGIVRDRDVLGFIQEKKRVFIGGAEKTGKTSLSKQLFKDLREAGYVPLLIRADFNVSQPSKESTNDRIRCALDKVLQIIYSPESSSRFWQTKIQERVLIVDDYSRLPVGSGGRDELVRWFDDNFGIVVLISSPGIRVSDILNRVEDDTLLWTFEHVDILECDAESRYGIIKKWLVAGADPYQITPDDLYEETVRYGQTIDTIIGQGVIPSLPMFILMMMQQMETHGNIDSATGLYGTLYELVIRDVIRSAAKNPADLEVKLNYLSEFAFALYKKRQRYFEEIEFNIWHKKYCDDFNCTIISEQMKLQFEALGVFKKHDIEIGFKYRYYYCFFLARYLAHHIHEEYAKDIVKELCTSLHVRDFANIVLFLCHLSKDPLILNLIMDRAKSHFDTADEYDLTKTPSIIPDGAIRPARLVLTQEGPEQERIKTLRQQDEVARPNGLCEMKDDEIEQKTHDLMELVNEFNSACQSIRICGQLIRNFYGSMKGDLQIEVIRECYGICLRSMSVLFEFLERDKVEIAEAVSEMLQHRYPDIDSEELQNIVKKSLYRIAFTICYGLIKHTSTSLGLSALKPTFDKLITSNDITLSHRMLDISTRLDYFDAFPEKSVLDVAKDLDGGMVGHEVLRILVWEHFKLFRRDYRTRQRVCEKLKIEANQAVLIESKEKRLIG
jgi:hypothetical protein